MEGIMTDDQDELELDSPHRKRISYTSLLITQGKHKLYSLAMPSDMLAQTCVASTAEADPEKGFQRNLNVSRAEDIASYIDNDVGTIPGAIVLSAQPVAELEYNGKTRTLSFIKNKKSFFILDGQHRVYGFRKAKTSLRVPVVIYNGLKKSEEVRLFIDINTKQRPIPGELLLHIKRLAETEENWETLLRQVFDLFNKEQDSPLFGLLTPTERRQGKISRVTFNKALKPILGFISETEAEYVYAALKPYLRVWTAELHRAKAETYFTNQTMFKAIILLFPVIAQRLLDLFGDNFTIENFQEILKPFFGRIKKNVLQNPGRSHKELAKDFADTFQAGFSLTRKGA